VLYLTRSGQLQNVTLPDGKVHPLKYHLQNFVTSFGSGGNGAITSDGKELAYFEHAETGKLVLVENPFVWK
jgi:hypothetical protein